MVSNRLPFSISSAIGGVRLPRSLGAWSIMVCRL
jgi:hypothetical protein